MATPGDSGAARSTALRQQREEIIERFEAAWSARRNPAIADFVPADPSERRALLPELIHVDLERRVKAGEAARVETYLERYPQLAEDRQAVVGLLLAEYRHRIRGEPDLAIADYIRRFPQYERELTADASTVAPLKKVSGPNGTAGCRHWS